MKKPIAVVRTVGRHLSIEVFGFGIASLALLVLFIRAVNHFDDSWDGTAYHLVFAAFRSGILSPNDLMPLPRFMDAYYSFPALLDIVNGYTWWITGSVLILQTFPLIAILTLACFWQRRFGLVMPWTVIAILTVPAIQTSATALYVDTFSNCAFAIPVSILSISFIDRRALSKADVAVSLIALAVAANCKPQFVVWATILLVLLCAHQLTFLVGLRKRNEIALFLSVSAVAFSAIVFVDLRNAVVFGNPFYPVGFNVFGHTMPGPWNSRTWDGPDYLRNAPQPVRWLLSILEYRAFDGRDTPYNIDQYEFIPVGFMPAFGSSLSPRNAYGWLLRALCVGPDCLARDFRQEAFVQGAISMVHANCHSFRRFGAISSLAPTSILHLLDAQLYLSLLHKRTAQQRNVHRLSRLSPCDVSVGRHDHRLEVFRTVSIQRARSHQGPWHRQSGYWPRSLSAEPES
jgi:hypothetical protein